MSVFSASIRHRSFYWQISALCFVLGLLLAAAAHTASQITRTGAAPTRAGFDVYGHGAPGAEEKKAAEKASHERESEIKKLRERNTELENKVAQGTDAADTLNKELQATKFLAGLTEAVGPGVQVTLVDSRKPPVLPAEQFKQSNLIHDVDIATIVNELKASGAEAIAVNGQRVIASTPIRCVGPVIHVNGVPAAPPYTIQAIGDQEAMFGGLNLPDGVLSDLRRYDPGMVRVDKKESLHLSAYAGSTQIRFARQPKQASKDGSK